MSESAGGQVWRAGTPRLVGSLLAAEGRGERERIDRFLIQIFLNLLHRSIEHRLVWEFCLLVCF